MRKLLCTTHLDEHRRRGRYSAQIWVKHPGRKGKQLHIGIYGSLQAAARAYDYVARNLYGEEAVTRSELKEALKVQLDEVMIMPCNC